MHQFGRWRLLLVAGLIGPVVACQDPSAGSEARDDDTGEIAHSDELVDEQQQSLGKAGTYPGGVQCARTIQAQVVALDQPIMFNRLGAQNVNGIVYALRRDVINMDSKQPLSGGGAALPGRVLLRPDKRPRPLVLRAAEGDCLQVSFQNLLTPAANPRKEPGIVNDIPFRLIIDDQVADRFAGFHAQGLQLVNSISDDSSFVGKNPSSLVPPGGTATYLYYAEKEGAFLVNSHGATFGGEGGAGNAGVGMFATVNVEPKRANFYRSQVTEEELRLATTGTTDFGQPVVNYAATYPNDCPGGVWCQEGKAGLPILNMLTAGNELVHADVSAIIAGPQPDGRFPPDTYPLESVGKNNPSLPNRLEAFREFTVVFHDEVAASQAFPGFFNDPVFGHTLFGVRDSFMINYGSAGVGSEVLANRLRVGPMHDCLDCAYEEFFLSSFTVGDPAMLVDVPANLGLETVAPGATPLAGTVGPKATRAFFPDDPANVHHSYTSDQVKFRNVHIGKEQHVFHLHNHQWLFNPNDDNSNYIDAQGVGPGSGYTYEISYGGAGNRNKTAGDAIFHCHFYPHFAQGMWELWRIHDTMETGTKLAVSGEAFHAEPFALQDGTPAAQARALPDGEIVAGTPIPAVVPVPGNPMAPMPGKVEVVPNPNTTTASTFHPLDPDGIVPVGSNAQVIERDKNPGYPFWVAPIEHTVGQRSTTPPLDMLSEQQASELQSGTNPLFAGRTDLVANAGGFDGGLPRHSLNGYSAGGQAISTVSRLDFSKVTTRAKPTYFPEEGTDVEQVAMAFHAQRTHPSARMLLNGTTTPGNFVTNGAPPMPSAPYHEPCIDDVGRRVEAGQSPQFFDGNGGFGITGNIEFGATNPRVYKGANIQIDVVFNKVGYHYPQERIITLWNDVAPTMSRERPPEPFVIRFNTFDCGKYLHTNLVPEAFELDDFQIRTPTDIIGQHIHLPKWDLTTTDGAANGWNYEDGTLSPGAVRQHIAAINNYNQTAQEPVPTLDGRTTLSPQPHPFFGAGPGGHWLGARTTIQRWFMDPVVNVAGVHRGLGTVFTHDHYGPSTHQQIGLYGSVLVEPPGAKWVHNESGIPLGTRDDGGPTTWQAAIFTNDVDGDGVNDSFREFWFQASDFQHAYEAGMYVGAGPDGMPDDALTPAADSFRKAINPPVRVEAQPVFPDLVVAPPVCPGGVPRPCPEAIGTSDPGMFVLNYRNEPVGLRVFDPKRIGPDGKPGTQAQGRAGDLAFALQSRTDRAIKELNSRLGDTPYPPLTEGIERGDPFTPIMRTFVGDRVRIRAQMGGHEEEFNITMHGLKWLQGGSSFGAAPNSGWRNAQAMGISEQFAFNVPVTPLPDQRNRPIDHAYSANGSQDGWWTGVWGVLRAYSRPEKDLVRLPTTVVPLNIRNERDFKDVCPRSAKVRSYDITAVLANESLPNSEDVRIIPNDASATQHEGGKLDRWGGTLVYNPRRTQLTNGKAGPLHDPTAILYFNTSDLDGRGRLKRGVPVEPVVLRAAAGECISVTVRNRLPSKMPDLANTTYLMGVVNRDRSDPNGLTTFNNNLIRPSSFVGLHPQLVTYDVHDADGSAVGQNPSSLVPPWEKRTVRFYAGDISISPDTIGDRRVTLVATPVEFGGTNLGPADKIKQGQKSLAGALVVLPRHSSWKVDAKQRTASTIDGVARDFVTIFQKHLNHRYADGSPVEATVGEAGALVTEDSADSGQSAINFRTEPMWFRFGLAPNSPLGNTPGGFGAVANAHEAYSNALVGGDPVTPVFTARAGAPVRMHLLEPHGSFRGSTFNLHGHVWQRDPYVCPGSAPFGLPGRCKPSEVASRTIGLNPQGFYLGGQEGLHPMSHFNIVLPRAGGANAIPGDYLFRDQAGFGNINGLWGIMRVQR